MENRDRKPAKSGNQAQALGPKSKSAPQISVETVENGAPEGPPPAENLTPLSPDAGFDLASFDLADEFPELTKAQPTANAAGTSSPQKERLPSSKHKGPSAAKPGHRIDMTPGLATIADESPANTRLAYRKLWLTTAPSWLISLVLHTILILILAAITLDPVQKVISILQASASSAEDSIDEFKLESPSLDTSFDSMEVLSDPQSTTSPTMSLPELQSPTMPTVSSNESVMAMNALTESIMPSSILNSSAMAQMSVSLNSRSTANKSELLERFGGTAASEKAVAMALKWIAAHQAPNGGWTFAHSMVCSNQCGEPGELATATNGATAMALLPFLGAGQTHLEGEYQQTVKAGLAFLINRMQVTSGAVPYGSWHEPGGRMYSHGLAAITICEAYAMTKDPDLLQPAQLALNYLVYAQDPRGGGWRYNPKEPGDTSVVGWCLMALKSGRMGNLAVPNECFAGADTFLNFVSTNKGAYYGYDKPTTTERRAMTAVGLLCRMYLGWPKDHPGLLEGIKFLDEQRPSSSDLYYSYYATQVMRHHGGPEWERWNSAMREALIAGQLKDGHASGSWNPEGHNGEKGGRLYQTSLATMILEVYYRHMPLYSEQSSDEDFEI